MSLVFGMRGAATLAKLADKCHIPPEALQSTFDEYKRMAKGESTDRFGKQKSNFHVFRDSGPYYAVDCRTIGKGWPPLMFSLGGLRVREDDGQVIASSGSGIPNLYAAGRVAVGVCSNFYVSGLVVADAVFSGRRAGEAGGVNCKAPDRGSVAEPIMT